MEDLKCFREKDWGFKELNGRLHRWSYRRFQQVLGYEAKLHGLNVKYVDPRNTSRACPVCGNELDPSPNKRRLMRCRRCGLEGDRDVIAVKNLTKRYYEECMNTKTSKNSLLCPATR
jgi:putative transposase